MSNNILILTFWWFWILDNSYSNKRKTWIKYQLWYYFTKTSIGSAAALLLWVLCLRLYVQCRLSLQLSYLTQYLLILFFFYLKYLFIFLQSLWSFLSLFNIITYFFFSGFKGKTSGEVVSMIYQNTVTAYTKSRWAFKKYLFIISSVGWCCTWIK